MGNYVKKEHEQRLKQVAQIGGALCSLGMSAMGLSPSVKKMLEISSESALPSAMIIGGAVTASIVALSFSPPSTVLNEFYREGLDSEVDAVLRMPDRMALVKSAAWSSIEGFIHKTTSMIRDVEKPLDNHKNSHPFKIANFKDRNAVNIVHAFALLGQDPTPYAKKLRDAPDAQNEMIQSIFSDSKNLIEILKPNMNSLCEFSNAVRQALGDDAKFIMKNCLDYNSGVTEWHALFEAVQKDYVSSAQKVSYHHQAVHLIASAVDASMKKQLTPDVAQKILEGLRKFNGVRADETRQGSPEQQTAEFSIRVAKRLEVLLLDRAGHPDNLNDFCQWAPVSAAGSFLGAGVDTDALKKVKDALFPWSYKIGGFSPETLFAQTFFKKMAESARNIIEKGGFADPAFVNKSVDPSAQQDVLRSLGVRSGEPTDLSVEQAAKFVVDKVQRRMAQSVIMGDHQYTAKADEHRDPSKILLRDYLPQEYRPAATPFLSIADVSSVESLPDLPTLASRRRR